VGVAEHIADALQAAHALNPPIVHRDLKPENVMCLEDGRVKVMDFGISKVLEQGSHTTQSMGTLQYMSPEQIDAAPIDGRSDLYSLGLVLYEMLTGAPPFKSVSPRELLNMQCTAKPPVLDATLRDALPDGLEPLLFRLLAKKPSARPATASEVVETLREMGRSAAPVVEPPVEVVTASAPEEIPEPEFDPPEAPPLDASTDDDSDALPAKTPSHTLPADPGSQTWQLVSAVLIGFIAGALTILFISPLETQQQTPAPSQPAAATVPPTPPVAPVPPQPPQQLGALGGVNGLSGQGRLGVPPRGGLKPVPLPAQTHRAPDGQILRQIASGTFLMGSPVGVAELDEQPQRMITMPEYFIDETEVTVSAYQQCVQSGYCDYTFFTLHGHDAMACNYSKPGQENHPMNCISYEGAAAFCSWRTANDNQFRYRLPSEREWEKAARGTQGQSFPWGSAPPSCTTAHKGGCNHGATAQAATYPMDRSPFGIRDMAGNVSEWVSSSDSALPRSLRGGNWKDARARRVEDRNTVPVPFGIESAANIDIGFRCVGERR